MLENVQAVLNRINSIRNKINTIRKTPESINIKKKYSSKSNKSVKSFGSELNKKINNITKKDEINQKIASYSKEYNIDPNLIRAIIKVESDFDPFAKSSKGAMGLMQLMPDTAASLGIKNAFDIDENIKGGISYLSKLIKNHSSLDEALAAYNAGPGAVSKHNGIPPYKETKDYIKKVLEIYKNGE